jgi:hypothetical protein
MLAGSRFPCRGVSLCFERRQTPRQFSSGRRRGRRRRRRRSDENEDDGKFVKASSIPEEEGRKFATLDDHTINTILGPHEARECSAWTDYQRISNLWIKKISETCNEKTKRKMSERHIEALSILFCQVAAKEEKVLEDPEQVISLCCRLADVFNTNVACVLRAFTVSPFLCFTDSTSVSKAILAMKRELPFCDVSNILTYRPELLACDGEVLSMRIRDTKETLESYGMPSPCVNYLLQEEPGLILGDGGFERLEQIRDAVDAFDLSLLKFSENGQFMDVDSERWFVNNFVNFYFS